MQIKTSVLSLCAIGALGFSASAGVLPFSTTESAHYLIVGMGPTNDFGGQPGVGNALNMNNFELGANKAPVPSTDDFLTGGSSGGPSLLGNVPNIPLNAQAVIDGVCNDGNVAITSPDGSFNLQDVGVYADRGVWTAASREQADVGTQNSFFNDPNMFPNTYTSSGFSNPGVNKNTTGSGMFVGPGDAVQSTRMDANNYAGVTGNVDFTALRNELSAAQAAIASLPSTDTINLVSEGGQITTDTTIMLDPGLNVIDFDTDGNDLLLSNSNLVIDGPTNSQVIFRIPDDANFNISNSNILAGMGGIGLDSIVFVSDREDNAQHFNISNAVLNGVAFWTLANEGGEINIDNAQGSVQLIADKVTLNDTRFCRCAFDLQVPTPGTFALAGFGFMVAIRRRR